MTWGFRQWFNTTVLGGPKWKEIQKLGVAAKDEAGEEIVEPAPAAPQPQANPGGEVKLQADPEVKRDEPEENLSDQVMKIMGYSESEIDYFQASTRFVNVLTGSVESQKDTLARQSCQVAVSSIYTWPLSLFGGRSHSL